MNAPNPSKVEMLRARDGERCWLCDGKLNFAAEPNSKRAPTKEHLNALANGGSNDLDNLVLCHPGCNKQLANRSKADKVKMRDKRAASRAKQMADAKPAKQPAAVNTTATAKQPGPSQQPSRSEVDPTPWQMPARSVQAVDGLVWQRIAFVATGACLFLAGLVGGLLLS